MADAQHSARLADGHLIWNAWRRTRRSRPVDLAFAALEGRDLHHYDFERARLDGAVLDDADLHAAEMAECSLIGARLGGADLSLANLAGADLRRSDLTGAKLEGAILIGADLRGATVEEAVLAQADLRESRTGPLVEEPELSMADKAVSLCRVHAKSHGVTSPALVEELLTHFGDLLRQRGFAKLPLEPGMGLDAWAPRKAEGAGTAALGELERLLQQSDAASLGAVLERCSEAVLIFGRLMLVQVTIGGDTHRRVGQADADLARAIAQEEGLALDAHELLRRISRMGARRVPVPRTHPGAGMPLGGR